MLRPGSGLALAAVVAVLATPGRVPAADTADGLAQSALAACEAGRAAKERSERERHFRRGQMLAERAIALDDANAEAHFSLFCNYGELMRIDGESITSVLGLRRLMAELDRTLVLDPNHVDAQAAKGTLLVRLPRLLGGDAERGEAMLREVIRQDPTAVSSRLTLARTCGARGDHEEAIAFASRALQIARTQGRADKVAEAQVILDELRADR